MAEQDGLFWIVDVVRGRWSAAEVEAVVAQTAQRDGPGTPVQLKQEPGAAGKSVVDHFTRRVLRGFAVHAARDSGSKVLRAQPFAASVEAGNVRLVAGPWNEAFLDEARLFPAGAHDDQVDAAADAWLRLGCRPS
jgi:predicted phage terminase large subunit-like protein